MAKKSMNMKVKSVKRERNKKKDIKVRLAVIDPRRDDFRIFAEVVSVNAKYAKLETEEDFEDTLDVVKKVGYEQVYMFIYSIREGTPGAKMENQIPEEIKHKRFDRLKALVESQIEVNNKKYVGTIQKVLIEGKSKNNEKTFTGRTDSNKVVIIDTNTDVIGKILNVKIVSEHMWYLKGEII